MFGDGLVGSRQGSGLVQATLKLYQFVLMNMLLLLPGDIKKISLESENDGLGQFVQDLPLMSPDL